MLREERFEPYVILAGLYCLQSTLECVRTYQYQGYGSYCQGLAGVCWS